MTTFIERALLAIGRGKKGPSLVGPAEWEKYVLDTLTPDQLAKKGDWFHAHADLKRALFKLQAAKDRKS